MKCETSRINSASRVIVHMPSGFGELHTWAWVRGIWVPIERTTMVLVVGIGQIVSLERRGRDGESGLGLGQVLMLITPSRTDGSEGITM